MKESLKKSVEYLDWHFTCDDGMADKDAQKAWLKLRGEFCKMDKKEIIRRLEKIAEHAIHTVGEPPFIIGLDDGIALKEAVRMLEKQEPESPVAHVKNGYWDHVCPACGSHDQALFYDWNYCPYCGQKLEWE